MKLLVKWALFSGTTICLVIGCSRGRSSAPMVIEKAEADKATEPVTSATPTLNYKVLSTDDSGNRTVEVVIMRSAIETRIRTIQNEQGETVEETYEREIPVQEGRRVIVPADEDIDEVVRRIQQDVR